MLAAGTALGPAQLGVLASIAHAEPLVHRAPRVAFLGSGDEIVDLDRRDEILAGTKIATSNSYTLHAAIRHAGGVPVELGVARDTTESLREHFARAADADLLVTTAGVSVGEHDLVRAVLTELGAEMKLWRIGMRPGAPVGFGLLGTTPWIGLPGNPVSTMVTFELLVRPAIRRMLGHARPFRRASPVVVAEPITLGPKLRHFLRGRRSTRGTVDRPSGLRHSDVDGPRQRPAHRSRGSIYRGGRRRAVRDPARRSPPRRHPPLLMATLSPASRRLLVSLGGALVLTALIYLANTLTPSAIKLGLLYLIPVLLVTWYEGVFWGAAVTLATAVLRLVIEVEQVPQDTIGVAVLNQLSFLAVAGIAIFGFRHIRRTQALLEDLAIRDPLTRVYNARAFAERLGQELKRTRRYGRPLSVLYLDLDDFKRVNDSHGHQTGDAVLKLVADAIRRAVRQADVVGRLGGDEFAVLMPETDGDLADAAAARLAKELRDAFKGTPAVTASVGVVSCTRAEAGVDEVLRQADQAMYQAKRKGKDQAVKVAI